MVKKLILILFVLITFGSCQKKIPSIVTKPPDEPLQSLAWQATQQINSRMPGFSVRMSKIEDQAHLSESQLHYFRGALENELWGSSTNTAAPEKFLSGILIYAEGQLQFLWETQEEKPEKIRGMVAVLWTIADTASKIPEHHQEPATHHHVEVDIPTPLAELQGTPLDVNQACNGDNEPCEVIVLYEDSIERIEWKTGNKRRISIPSQYFSSVRSRAPSGKILNLDGSFVILHNNLSQPLKYDSKFDSPAPANLSAQIPVPVAGLNIYQLMNGRFFDFEILNPKGMAVIQEDQRLSIGIGTLTSSNEAVGGSLTVIWPAIYTSSISLPGEDDSLLKFLYENSSLHLQSKVAVGGEIQDLAATDLNQDKSPELLITIRRNGGIFIEVMETF